MKKLFLTLLFIFSLLHAFPQIDLYEVKGITNLDQRSTFRYSSGLVTINYYTQKVYISFKEKGEKNYHNESYSINHTRGTYNVVDGTFTDRLILSSGKVFTLLKSNKSPLSWFDFISNDGNRYRLLCLYVGDQSCGM